MRTLKLHQVLPEQKKKKKQGKRERKKTKFWPLKPQVQNVMSRNKTIMGENGFVGHFYWIGDDLNQVQNSNLLFEGQVWGEKDATPQGTGDPSKSAFLTCPARCLQEKREENITFRPFAHHCEQSKQIFLVDCGKCKKSNIHVQAVIWWRFPLVGCV